jgi:ABC-type amino acid transport substrate-binding protein
MDLIALASLIVAVVALYFGWLQIDHRFKKNKQAVVANLAIDVLQEVLAKKAIRVGCFNYPPFVNYIDDSNNEPTGYYPTIIKQISLKYDLTISWKYISISNSVEAIVSKEVDIIISVFQTPKRAKLVDFCCLSHCKAIT